MARPIPRVDIPPHLLGDEPLRGLMLAYYEALTSHPMDPPPGSAAEARWNRAVEQTIGRARGALGAALVARGEDPAWVDGFLGEWRGLQARWGAFWERLGAGIGARPPAPPQPGAEGAAPISRATRDWLAAKVADDRETFRRQREAGHEPSPMRLQLLAIYERLLSESDPPPPDRSSPAG